MRQVPALIFFLLLRFGRGSWGYKFYLLSLIFLRVVALVELRIGIHWAERRGGLFKGAASALRAFPLFPLHYGGFNKALGGEWAVKAIKEVNLRVLHLLINAFYILTRLFIIAPEVKGWARTQGSRLFLLFRAVDMLQKARRRGVWTYGFEAMVSKVAPWELYMRVSCVGMTG